MHRFQISTSIFALGFFVACVGNHPPSEQGTPTVSPSITSLSPSTGRVGEAYPIEVTIEGTGFAEVGNIVTFGGIPSEALASTDGGSRITFLVPKVAPSPGEAPPMVLDPGEYEVTVTTPEGTSDPVLFTLTRGV